MFTDMVGYSAVVSRDEPLALRLLDEHREIVRTEIVKFGGREVKTIGDGFMLEFRDGLSAVQCAVAFLAKIEERNLAVLPSERIRLRVGVHTGQVTDKEGDLLGDAVNIAARIEPLAEPGTVCVSPAVHEEIHGKIDQPIVRLGRAQLKNMDRIPTLRLVMPDDERRSGTVARVRFYSRQPRIRRIVQGAVLLIAVVAVAVSFFRTTPHVSTLAIADFANETGDPDLEGLSGLLATALEQSPTLSVVTRSRLVDALGRMGKDTGTRIDEGLAVELCRFAGISTFVRGTVRRFDQVYVLEASVVDAASGRTLGGLSVRGERKESIPGLVESLAERLRGRLGEPVAEIERTRIGLSQSTTDDVAVYRLYFDGEQHLARGDFAAAQASFEESVELDPEFALGWQRLGYVMGWRGVSGANDAVRKALALRASIRTRRERSFLAIQEANLAGDKTTHIALLEAHLSEFPDDKEALFQLGDLRHHNGDFAAGLSLFERALALDPAFERALDHRMWALLSLDRTDEAHSAGEDFLRRHPSIVSFRVTAEVLLAAGRVDQGEAIFVRARATFPEHPDLLIDLAHARVFRGDFAGAREILEAAIENPVIRENPALQSSARGRLATVEVLANRFDASEAQFRKVLTAPGRTGNASIDARVVAEHAFLLAWHGREKEARKQVAATLAGGHLEDRYVLLPLVLACGKLRDPECFAKLPRPNNHQKLAEGFERLFADDPAGAAAAFAEPESFSDLRARLAYTTLEADAWLAAGNPKAALAAARAGTRLRFLNSVDAVFRRRALDVEARAGAP